ncbi:cobalamin-dependent protein [Roseibacterium beibuensis]|uniref:Oxygen-sensing regulator PpaA n=1 Tax=[Roseibacterium] beibuensis TaxID=1193142 RepID=A0ABP9LCG9_9RHOB|nr:cobalamin-dependent protein [Roseibacterium beibuensis]MCS6624326.1 cobalamin-dependent protein [Roseibacterium beibuensis]
MKRICRDKEISEISEEVQRALGSPLTAALVCALCDVDDESAEAIVNDLIAAGVSVEDICVDHLAAAARRLGEMWEADTLPFTEVTMASARIQSIMRQLPPPRKRVTHHPSRGAVFCAVPGEEHTLGVMMAADLFRRNGWDVSLLVGMSHEELVDRLTRDDRGVIGVSCSGLHSRPALIRLIEDLRRVRPAAHLVLAGQIVTKPSELAGVPTVDGYVASFQEAEAALQRIEGRVTS